MIPLDINTAHFRWDRLEPVTIELAVLVLLSGRKERKRRHNDNMRKTDKTSINILILCLTMDGNWFITGLFWKGLRSSILCHNLDGSLIVMMIIIDQTITSRERLSMVVVGDLWRFVKVRSGLAIKKLWMRSCWPLARRRKHQSTGGEERQGREPAGQSILKHLGGAWDGLKDNVTSWKRQWRCEGQTNGWRVIRGVETWSKRASKSELVVKHVEQLAAEKVIKRFKYRCLSIKRPYKNFIGRRLLKVSGWCHHVSNVLPLWIRHYLRVRWRWKPFYIS